MISGQKRKPLSDIIITVPYFIKYDVRVKRYFAPNIIYFTISSISQPSAICIVYHNAISLLHHTIYLFFSVTERLLVTVNGVNSNDYFFIFPLHTYAVHEGLLLQRYISPDAQAGSGLSAEILQIPDQIPDLLPDRMS